MAWGKIGMRLGIAVLLGPATGVLLCLAADILTVNHAREGNIARNHPLYLVGATISAIIFVYLTGGRG